MIASPALHTHDTPRRVADFVRAIPAVYRTVFLATVVCACVAVAAYQGDWLRAPAAAAPASPVIAASGDAKAHARRRCDTCGYVESIRHIRPVGGTPGSYEFIVRLRDGSTRTSSDPSETRWRTGDRVMLLGGTAVK